MKEIYNPAFVENLFDKMSGSYERMNKITSFGFSSFWRKKCVNELALENAEVVVDLMTGMGECWSYIFNKTGDKVQLIAIDFSSQMLKQAEIKRQKLPEYNIQIMRENVFSNTIATASADFVISCYGLKTFSELQLKQLVAEIDRILKAGGEFSIVEVSVPTNVMLRWLYMFYIKNVIPVLGWLFLGNPETYKMLGIYTEKYRNTKAIVKLFQDKNLEVEYLEYFYGCASGIKGKKKLV